MAIGLLFAAATAGTASAQINQGPPAGAILDLNGTPITQGAYAAYGVNFTASVASTDITFALREDPAFLSLTDIVVTDLTHPSGNLILNGDFSGGTDTSNGNTAAAVDWDYANIYGASFGGVVESGSGLCYTAAFCWYDGAVQAYDAIDQFIATNIGDTYHISFLLGDNSNCDTNTTNPCNYSDFSTNGDITNTGGNGINLTVYALAGLPAAAPEPSSFLLLGIGLVGLLAFSSRKRLGFSA